MNPIIHAPKDAFMITHRPSQAVRRVVAAREFADGTVIYELAQCIKFRGETIYLVNRQDCWS